MTNEATTFMDKNGTEICILLERLENHELRAGLSSLISIAEKLGFEVRPKVYKNPNTKHYIHFKQNTERSARYGVTINKGSLNFYFRKQALNIFNYSIQELNEIFGSENVKDLRIPDAGRKTRDEISVIITESEKIDTLAENFFK